MWGRLRQLVTTHVTLTVSLALAVLVALRALYFARFNLSVAFSVLALTDQATLLITTLAMAVTAGVSIIWVFDPGGYVNRAHLPGTPRGIVFGTTIAMTALLPLIYGSFMSPIVVAVVTVSLIVWAVLKIRRSRRPDPSATSNSNKNRLAWAAGLVCGTVLTFFLSQPWMPSEEITTFTSSKPIVGYVVGEQAGQLLVLDLGRQPVWIKVSDISRREVCETHMLPPGYRWITTPVNRLGTASKIDECADA